eukprot:6492713-Pyramimonas_sp.AAC.1
MWRLAKQTIPRLPEELRSKWVGCPLFERTHQISQPNQYKRGQCVHFGQKGGQDFVCKQFSLHRTGENDHLLREVTVLRESCKAVVRHEEGSEYILQLEAAFLRVGLDGQQILYLQFPFYEKTLEQVHLSELLRMYLKHALRGLAFLHRKRIVHGDVHPRNIMVGYARAVLADFDMSTAIGGRLLGGPPQPYCAPEIEVFFHDSEDFFYGSADCVAATSSDMYSFGVIVREREAWLPYKQSLVEQLTDGRTEARLTADAALRHGFFSERAGSEAYRLIKEGHFEAYKSAKAEEMIKELMEEVNIKSMKGLTSATCSFSLYDPIISAEGIQELLKQELLNAKIGNFKEIVCSYLGMCRVIPAPCHGWLEAEVTWEAAMTK